MGLLGLLSFSAYAAGGAGSTGGGNALVCFDNPQLAQLLSANAESTQGVVIPDSDLSHIVSIEALDLYEAETPRGLSDQKPSVLPIGSNETVQQYLSKIENRFGDTVPSIADLVRQGFTDFPESNIIHETMGLSPTDDTNSVVDPIADNCVLATMAVQYAVGKEHYVHIDDRLFNHPKNSKLSRAVLLLHEFVYSQARKRGQTDSRNTRLLLAVMIENNPAMMVKDMIDQEVSLGFANTNTDYPEGWEKMQGIRRGFHCPIGNRCAYYMNSALGLQVLQRSLDLFGAVQVGDSWDQMYIGRFPGFTDAYQKLYHKLNPDQQKVLGACEAGADNCAIALRALFKQGLGGSLWWGQERKDLAQKLADIIVQAQTARNEKLAPYVFKTDMDGRWQIGAVTPLPGVDPKYIASANQILRQWVIDLSQHFPKYSYGNSGTTEEEGISPEGTIFKSWSGICANLDAYYDDYFFYNNVDFVIDDALNYPIPSVDPNLVLY